MFENSCFDCINSIILLIYRKTLFSHTMLKEERYFILETRVMDAFKCREIIKKIFFNLGSQTITGFFQILIKIFNLLVAVCKWMEEKKLTNFWRSWLKIHTLVESSSDFQKGQMVAIFIKWNIDMTDMMRWTQWYRNHGTTMLAARSD